jgi:hypothetical protein
MNCEQVGLDLSAFIRFMISKTGSAIREVVGGDPAVVDANYLVLLNWATTWRVRVMIPSHFRKPILDAMHKPMFAALAALGVDSADLDTYVQVRYRVFYDARESRETYEEVIYHIAACFVGLCNLKPGQIFIYYSLDGTKIMPLEIELGAFCVGVQDALVKIIELNS